MNLLYKSNCSWFYDTTQEQFLLYDSVQTDLQFQVSDFILLSCLGDEDTAILLQYSHSACWEFPMYIIRHDSRALL